MAAVPLLPLLAAGSAVFQTIGTITQAEQAASAANRNADILNQQATQRQQEASVREGQVRDRSQQLLASQRAALSQNGVDPLSGSAGVGVLQNMRDAELDALTERYKGLLEANSLRADASMERYRAKATRRQGYFSAAGQLMQSGSNYLSMGGFGKNGPGFSGSQAPAPVETRSPYGRG